jgi:mono/diheme cytochrome c family protein
MPTIPGSLADPCVVQPSARVSRRYFVLLAGSVLAASVFASVLASSPAWGQSTPAKPARASDRSALVSRGKYIVDGVAMCGTCHSPHFSSGAIDTAHYLEGAPLWLNPTMTIPGWPLRAPRLVGTPPGTDAELITLLTTGEWKDGKRLKQPMPQFRMTREDAEAVIAYLRSLTPGPQ